MDCELEIHDVLIVGAGPCGLAVASRLCEPFPSALYTDAEHHRYHWLRKQRRDVVAPLNTKFSITKARSGKYTGEFKDQGPKCIPYKMVILDSTSSRWLARWRRNFEIYCITHLRSPMYFHTDPRDRDGLLAFVYEKGRLGDLREIGGVVGKDLSKHKKKKKLKGIRGMKQMEEACCCGKAPVVEIDERQRQDYFTPSRELFEQYCRHNVERYGIESLVSKEEVRNLEYGFVDGIECNQKIFTLASNMGVHYARTVVLAIGNTGMAISQDTDSKFECHSSALTADFPPAHLRCKIQTGEEVHIIIVGGGLTSAQIADIAVRRGVTKVWHIMRGPIKVKPFDVDLSWVGKYKNLQKSVFWSTDDAEDRTKMITQARNGGSITPGYAKVLKQHEAAGRLSIYTYTSLKGKAFDMKAQKHIVKTSPAVPDLPPIDFIVYATGTKADFSEVSFLSGLREQFDIPQVGGLPCLTEELALSKDLPCFVTGRLAGLMLGPGAGNLEGAREGAERIAWGIENQLGRKLGRIVEGEGGIEGNRYELLDAER